MSVYKKNNKFISYLIILSSLFILVLITKNQIVKFQQNNDLQETYNIELKEKTSKLGELNNLKNRLANSSNDISKYKISVKENELIDYIYTFVENISSSEEIVRVNNISIGKPSETEIGFTETLVNLSLRVPNEKKLKLILDFITSENSKYNFFIKSFSFPYSNTSEKGFNVSIPITILYK